MKSKIFKIINILFFLIYILFLSRILILDRPGGIYTDMDFRIYLSYCNIVPFKIIIEYIGMLFTQRIPIRIVLENLFGNLVLFMPFAYFIFIFTKFKLKKFIIINIFIVFLIELIQFITLRGVFDIDDIILNSLGGFIAYYILTKYFGKFKEFFVN